MLIPRLTPIFLRRSYATRASGRSISWRKVSLTVGLGTAAACTGGIVALGSQSRGDESKLTVAIRSYIVYTMCSFPTLVDMAPRILEICSSIPGVKQISEAIVRVTFFNQFVGGDTALETLPLLHNMRSENKGVLFAYSVEVDEPQGKKHGPPPHKRIVQEMINSIDVAADFEDELRKSQGRVDHKGRRTWVAVKMTALVPDADALIKLSSHVISSRSSSSIPFPGCPKPNDLDILHSGSSAALGARDIESLRDLHSDLIRICTRAQQRGVRIIIDAEYSWYQPAIDALQLSLMRQFNRYADGVQPLVYGTFQAYLRRTPELLAQSLIDARAGGYSLGVKLVRGAYHPHELAAHKDHSNKTLSISPDDFAPVWTSKTETDQCYNACAKVLVAAIRDDLSKNSGWFGWLSKNKSKQDIGVLFGTHNWNSCNLILDELVRQGLAALTDGPKGPLYSLDENVTERITMGQLFGMTETLSDYLVDRMQTRDPIIIKYVPYGALSEVMPYLSRRAIENKSILGDGAAAEERRLAAESIKKWVLGR
ncbi:FAD-linked oxidoreductase-like protein [Mycena floridula]|nr:FAD-linked oxidoreductase-like protein [Mycena floridula]